MQQNDGLIRSLLSAFWHRLYHIRMLEGRDVQPDNDPHGLFARLVNRTGIGTYSDHFRSGVIPAGFAWIVDGTFNGIPGTLSYSLMGTYLAATSTATPHFLATPVVGFANARYTARISAGQTTEIGIRLDDGTNANTAEVMLTAAAQPGMYQAEFRQTLGGVPAAAAPGPIQSRSEFITVRLYWRSASVQVFGYILSETGSTIGITGWNTGAGLAWVPARVGIKVRINGGDGGYVDWFYSTFT